MPKLKLLEQYIIYFIWGSFISLIWRVLDKVLLYSYKFMRSVFQMTSNEIVLDEHGDLPMSYLQTRLNFI